MIRDFIYINQYKFSLFKRPNQKILKQKELKINAKFDNKTNRWLDKKKIIKFKGKEYEMSIIEFDIIISDNSS